MIHRAGAALLLGLSLTALPSTSARALPGHAPGGPLPSGPITASVVRDGVRLSLKVPRRSYPRNALVRVTLTLTNITDHSVDLGAQDNGNGFCTTSLPQAEVHSSSGTLLFPPAVKPLLYPPCAYNFGTPLAAGQSLVHREYVVLRGPILTGIASTRTDQSLIPFSTPPLTLPLTHEPQPTAAINTSPLGIDITSPVPVTGKLHYISAWICPSGETVGLGEGWKAVPGTHIDAPCAGTSTWRVAAGWLNHPLIVLHYPASH